MGDDKATEWFVSYLTTYCVDTFMIENFFNFWKIKLVRNELIYGKY